MSWPLASFAIVAGVLAVGWFAYERSRPSSRMVALVGTLAALAALGRDAFVALPDVKPITAMTFVVGYSLGPLAGFSVGAIGMLASNILLGEGSYTPWQMVAWGGVGLAGAALGAITARRAGRVPIAVGCAVSAAAAKETMNLYTWTLGASHTPGALLATAGAALPFDVTDALASLLFGLAFGPALARMLGRMRARMTVTWQAAAMPVLVTAMVCCGILSLAVPARADVAGEVAFLRGAQNADGGFGGAPGQRSSELYSAWAALGLSAAGVAPAQVRRDGHSVLDAIRSQAATLEGTGDIERTILALRACGAPPRLPGRGDLVRDLLHARVRDGSFEDLVDITSFAVLALRAAGRAAGDPVVRGAAAWLASRQSPSGGFGYAGQGAAADVDDTGSAIQALVAAGERHGAAVKRAAHYLVAAIGRDGGLPQRPGEEANAQSTAWAIQGLIAAGLDPARRPPGAARSPLGYLESLRARDGSVRYSSATTQTPVWVTAQALTALARRPLPVDSPPPPRPAAAGVRRAPTAASAPRRVAPAGRRAASPPGSHGSVSEADVHALARDAGLLIGVIFAFVVH